MLSCNTRMISEKSYAQNHYHSSMMYQYLKPTIQKVYSQMLHWRVNIHRFRSCIFIPPKHCPLLWCLCEAKHFHSGANGMACYTELITFIQQVNPCINEFNLFPYTHEVQINEGAFRQTENNSKSLLLYYQIYPLRYLKIYLGLKCTLLN